MFGLQSFRILVGAAVVATFSSVTPSFAGPLDITGLSCDAGNSVNDIAVGDVTGNAGNPSDCFGTIDGNDPKNDGIVIGGVSFNFLTKYAIEDGTEGVDIDLTYDTDFGTWAYDSQVTLESPWILVLKQASSPGWAAWLFEGSAAASTSGTYSIAWRENDPFDLSHMVIYGNRGDLVPEPGPLGLLGLGIVGLYVARRRRFVS